MRSTIKIASNTALNNILSNYSRVLDLQNQMSRGQRVVNPSDDPLATNEGMRLDTLIGRIEQFNRNISVGDSFLALSDAAIGDANDALSTAKSLTIGAASDTTTHEMRNTMAVEMNNLLQEIVNIGNRQDGTRYIFGGTETQETPFEVVGGRYVHYRGNEKLINVQVDGGNYMPINITGEKVFGSMVSVLTTRDLSPDVNMSVDLSTRLEDLNLGKGVPDGSINVRYTAFPNNGLDIDLTGADTLEDVKDIIERASVEAANDYVEGTDPEWDYVLRVFINPDHNGIRIEQWDRDPAPPTPPATWTYTAPVDLTADPLAQEIEIREVGENTVARDLGILGTGTTAGISELVGTDVNPVLSERTLLADLEGYRDGPFTITNGAKPDTVIIREVNDSNNYVDSWSLSGLNEGVNTDLNGELYTRLTSLGAGQWRVEVFNSETRLPTELVAMGEGAAGTVVLNEINNSGVTGTVGLNPPAIPPATPIEIDMETIFDPTFRSSIHVPAFQETGTQIVPGYYTSDLAEGWQLRGLEKGIDTDADGNMTVEIERVGADVQVRVYHPTSGTLIANGTLEGDTEGLVRLDGAVGYEHLTGSVHVEWPPAALAAIGNGPHTLNLQATFATVGDLINEVNSSNTYTTARVNENGRALDIISHLGGAYLTVAEDHLQINQFGDDSRQLSQMNLNGMVKNVNTDRYGNIYAEVEDLTATTGVYEVRLYSDRAHQSLVAVGQSTAAQGLVTFVQANESGLTGSAFLDYGGDDDTITLGPGGLRVYEDRYQQVSQVDFQNVVPGVNADFQGNLYIELEDTGVGANPIEVRVYADAKHTNLVATGNTSAGGNLVTLNAVGNSGLGFDPAPGAATTAELYIDYSRDDFDIVVKPGALRLGGQSREQNIFSTFNDVIDAMLAQDSDALGGLIGNYDVDQDRLLLGRAEIGSRQNRMEMLTNRHDDEVLNFGQVRADRIDLDYADAITRFQAEQNVFEASLRTTAQLIPLSLVDFI